MSLQLKEPGHQGLEDPVRGALVDSPLDDRSLTPPARQGTKEGPTPSLPEGAAPANVAVGSQDATDEGGASARVAQAHRIPGDLLPHGPAGPAPVATDCGDARDPPTASPPASTTSATQSSDAALRGRSWQTLALLLPDCRECVPDPVVGFTPNHEATCSRSALLALDGGRGPRPRIDRTRRDVPLGSWRTRPLPGN